MLLSPDGPDSLNVAFENKSLSCSAEGNPTPVFHWIEVSAHNKVHRGHELNLCNTSTFQQITTVSLDLHVTFQCVAEGSSGAKRRNQTVNVKEMKEICRLPAPGFSHIIQSNIN
jgi:hypothetical protein